VVLGLRQKNYLVSIDIARIKKYDLNGKVSVIVVDDDSSESYSFVEQHEFIDLIKNNKNLGAPLSRYKGFEFTNSKFIHFHDSDDSISVYWLREIIDALEKNPTADILLTARSDVDNNQSIYKVQKFFDRYCTNKNRVKNRLVYRNCMGPLGGVTFSRRGLDQVQFKNFASCQDWQMYIDAIKQSRVLISRPDIRFIFNKTGDDRISHNPRKKILGHLQLAKITGPKSPFGRNIRLFYLYTCKQHVFNKGGQILTLYKKNRFSIFAIFLVISVYWRLT